MAVIIFKIIYYLRANYYLRIQILARVNFSDFAITCSINSKMCDKF